MSRTTSFWSRSPLPRLLLGVRLSRGTRRLKIAAVRGQGQGWSWRWQSTDALSLPLPPLPIHSFESAPHLTSHCAEAVRQGLATLLHQTGFSVSTAEALGLDVGNDLGFAGELASYLAEWTGITVVHFTEPSGVSESSADIIPMVPPPVLEATDWQRHGSQTPPLACQSPIPWTSWLMVQHSQQPRLVLTLGQKIGLTWLAANATPHEVEHDEPLPGALLLDGLVQKLSRQRLQFDPSGHIAVQGRCHEQLRERLPRWLHDGFYPLLAEQPPATGSAGISWNQHTVQQLIDELLTCARQWQLSASDLLCTVCHCLATATRAIAAQRWPQISRLQEILITGGGLANGMLARLLRERFAPIPLVRGDALGLPAEAHRAVHAALAAYICMENLTIRPVGTPIRHRRFVGQITPGSPENWDRWVNTLADRMDQQQRFAA